jgi:hypothetical protein
MSGCTTDTNTTAHGQNSQQTVSKHKHMSCQQAVVSSHQAIQWVYGTSYCMNYSLQLSKLHKLPPSYLVVLSCTLGKQVHTQAYVSCRTAWGVNHWLGHFQPQPQPECKTGVSHVFVCVNLNTFWGGFADTLGQSGCTLQGRCLHYGIMPLYLVWRVPFSGESMLYHL